MITAEALLHGASIVLLIFVTLASASIVFRTLRNGVPPMPSSRRVRKSILGLLWELHPPQHAAVVELGSGWGSLSLALSRALPTAALLGYENSPVPFWFSVALRCLFRVGNLRLVRADFFRVSLREADFVVCYLSPDSMSQLQPKFTAELKESAVVVSSTFALPGWMATRIEVADDVYRTPVYVYLAGRCRSEASARHVDIVVSLVDTDHSEIGPE